MLGLCNVLSHTLINPCLGPLFVRFKYDLLASHVVEIVITMWENQHRNPEYQSIALTLE